MFWNVLDCYYLYVSSLNCICYKKSGAHFLKVPKTFRAQKAIGKTVTRLLCEAGLFKSVKTIKMKTTAKFCASRHFHFAGRKRIMSPNMLPKILGLSRNQSIN